MIRILTPATHQTSGLVNFVHSFEAFEGWSVDVVGLGHAWQSHRTAMTILHESLRDQLRAGVNELTAILDGYDILCVRSSENFKSKFNEMNCKIVAGYEPLCGGNCLEPKVWGRHHGHSKKYVNSGCIIGYTQDLYDMYEWILTHRKENDDQICLSHFMNAFPEQVRLDLDSTFVFNDNYGKTGKYGYSSERGVTFGPKQPYFIHFPGFMSGSIAFNPSIDRPPPNYLSVGHYILKNKFIAHQPVNKMAFRLSMIVVYMIISILLLVVVILSLVLARTRKRCFVRRVQF